jgi:hypothetical protein
MLSSTLPPVVDVVDPVLEVMELNSSLTPWPNCSVLVCPKPVADLTWSSSYLVSYCLHWRIGELTLSPVAGADPVLGPSLRPEAT